MPETEGAQPPDEIAAASGGDATTAAAPAASDAAAPSDANELRGYHFRQLLRSGKTWALILIPALVVAGIGAATVPLLGGVGFVAVVFVGIVAAFFVADRRAANAFFSLYAGQHQLELGGKAPLPAATPLLRKGDARYAERTLTGQLAPDCSGLLALYTYEQETTDGDGNTQTNYYHYTVGLTSVPECTDLVPELYCQRKFGLRSLQKFEDVFRRSKQRVKLESEALDEKYEIFSGKDQDPNWLRQLFAPSFIVWLTDSAPPKFAFELVDGNLCCYVNGHKEDSADLDTLATATAAVARRLRDEATE
ncbi:MAG: hypothetical protein JST31_12415 [Actinobacteria bacterium]|nr:hypothetical protein [Actinomycetota bacterium]